MKKLNLALAIVVSTVLLSGCKLDKMIKLAQENDLQVNPNPLEVHGGNIPFDMSAVLPPKMLPASTSFTLDAVYEYGDQEVKAGSVVFTAADFPSSATTTSRKSESFSFPYVEGMNPGTLYITGVATDTRSGKSKSLAKMPVAQGLVMTSGWVQSVSFASYAGHGYDDREELIPTNVDFYFDQGRSNLRTGLSYDGTSNRSKRDELNAFIAEKNVTRTVTITGSHSPEGTETINSDLSADRAKTIENYYRARMDRYDYKETADDIEFIIKPVVQNWNGFKTALASYEGIASADKDTYLRMISGSGSFEEKEKEMKKLPTYKKVFNDLYPGLRSAKTEVLTVKPKKSNAEIAVLAKAITSGDAKIDTLTAEELMFSATLTPSMEEKAAIYKAAADATGSWEAHNNLGATHLSMGNLDDAATQLEIAANKNGNSAIVQANLGAVQALQMDYDKAYATLGGVSGASNDVSSKVNAMKGAIEVRMAKYDDAKASFASAMLDDAANIDKGLAHLLTEDYSEANSALGNVSSDNGLDGIAAYLMAVSAARTNNATGVGINLKKAIDADPSLKDKALNDLEFVKFDAARKGAIK